MVDQQSTEATAATRRITLRALYLPEAITVGTLSQRMQADPIQVIKQLMRAGVFANVNQVIDFDTAAIVARTFGFSARKAEEASTKRSRGPSEEDEANLKERPPVVTILGHVDHGKTTLLDSIRKTNVVAKEAGGITQHVGAYQVEHNGHRITFIDTPGHEAFTAMRARGAQATDIAVLVVAADDGVMPQTIEAINHIKAANVTMIVAINKMDVPSADPERVRRQLSEQELLVEKWGGDIIDVEVSAKAGKGIEDLLESILLVAEISEFKANPDREAEGVVLEAQLDKSRGPIASVLVQTGTLRLGDYIVVDTARGRVKALMDSNGRRLRSAGPSTPVEILGLGDLPNAGDRMVVVADEKTAREMVTERQRAVDVRRARGMTLEELGSRVSTGQSKELNLILKTDVQGTIDAVRQALEQLTSAEVQVRILHAATGSITESDALLAAASDAIIVGFNVRVEPGARRLADQDGIQIRTYDIIYRLVEDIQTALTGMMEPITQDVVEGKLEVRVVFDLSKSRRSAGCFVTEGQVRRGSYARIMRDGELVFDGPISGLRRFKDDVREVKTGYECGVTFEGFNDIQEGDVVEVHRQQRAAS